MQRQTIESLDERLVNITRFILALSALIIIYIDPSEPDRLVNVTYATLTLYTVYSAGVYFLSLRYQSVFRSIPLYWLDVGWYVLLISLSSGTNSLFFFFFFFVILVASFSSGYKAGMKVTFVSAILFVTVGYYATPSPIEPNRFLLRAIYLASIGYLMAYWGGSETMHKRRLALLRMSADFQTRALESTRQSVQSLESFVTFTMPTHACSSTPVPSQTHIFSGRSIDAMPN